MRGAWIVVALLVGCRKEVAPSTTDAASNPATVEAPRCEVLRDCDGDPKNGCETRIGTGQHCSACGDRCGAERACVAGRCRAAGEIGMSRTHTCVLDAKGSVRCWGANGSGEVGDGTTTMRERPVLVEGVDAVQLVVHDRTTCVRTRAGAVQCWGGTMRKDARDVGRGRWEIDALAGVTDLAVSDGVFCGLLPDRTIRCLAAFKDVQPEDGPPPGPPTADVVDIAATPYGLCAAQRSGGVVCWNLRPSMETKTPRREAVPGVLSAVAITAQNETTCAFRPDGTAQCWGGGIVTAPGTMRANMVGGTHDFARLGPMADLAFVGWPHTEDCGTRDSGETVCWPPPYLREDRDAGAGMELATKTMPVPIAVRIASTKSPTSHCVLGITGDVHCWGELSRGRLGIGRAPEQPSPRVIEGVTNAREIVASDFRACARTPSSTTCWGAGKLPQPVKVDGLERLLSGRCASIKGELVCFDGLVERPLPASGLKDVEQLVPARRGTHVLSYWARDKRGDLHRVDWERSNTAVETWSRQKVARVRNVSGVRELLVGDRWACATSAARSLRCWESLGDGKPDGDGLAIDLTTIAVPEAMEQVQIVGGGSSPELCGVRTGRIGCWTAAKPEVVWKELEGVRRFKASARRTSCALVTNGALHCWGASAGQGTLADTAKPTPVPGLSGVVDWSFAQDGWNAQEAVFAWLADGRVFAWGDNGSEEATSGQLGWLGPTRITEPQKVTF